MNIEEIKKETVEAEEYLGSVKSDYYYDDNLGRHLDTTIFNVNTLLSIIETAEKALGFYANAITYIDGVYPAEITEDEGQQARAALQVIRGN